MSSHGFVESNDPRILQLPHHHNGELIEARYALHTRDLRSRGIIGNTEDSPYRCIDKDHGAVMHKRVSNRGTHFFAHASGQAGNCTGPSLRHETAKLVTLELLSAHPSVTDTDDEHTVQTQNGAKRADGMVEFDTGEVYYLEVVHTHHPDPKVVEGFGERMLVLDLNHISDDDVYDGIAPAYFVQEVLRHQDRIREIKTADELDSQYFQMNWRPPRIPSAKEGGSRFARKVRDCYSMPLLEPTIGRGFVCKTCGKTCVSIGYCKSQSGRCDSFWTWSASDDAADHEFGETVPLQIDISDWDDSALVREELLRLEHYRFHIVMGKRTQRRMIENAEAKHPNKGVPRNNYHIPPLKHDSDNCAEVHSVRSGAMRTAINDHLWNINRSRIETWLEDNGDSLPESREDFINYLLSQGEANPPMRSNWMNSIVNAFSDVKNPPHKWPIPLQFPEVSIDELDKEVSFYVRQTIADNEVAVGMVPQPRDVVENIVRQRLEDLWAITDEDIDAYRRYRDGLRRN